MRADKTKNRKKNIREQFLNRVKIRGDQTIPT